LDRVDQVRRDQTDQRVPDFRWGLWDQVDQQGRAGLCRRVGSCHRVHRCPLVPSRLVFRLGRAVREVQWDQLDRVFLVGPVELEEPAVPFLQLGQVGLLVPVDPVVAVGMWDNFPELVPEASYHRDLVHPDYQVDQAYRRGRHLQPGLWVRAGTYWPVVQESNCIRALGVFGSGTNRRY